MWYATMQVDRSVGTMWRGKYIGCKLMKHGAQQFHPATTARGVPGTGKALEEEKAHGSECVSDNGQ